MKMSLILQYFCAIAIYRTFLGPRENPILYFHSERLNSEKYNFSPLIRAFFKIYLLNILPLFKPADMYKLIVKKTHHKENVSV